jgi:hypothetical protein
MSEKEIELIELLAPKAELFFIIPKLYVKVPILKFENINIQLHDKIEFIEGEKNINKTPCIVYEIIVDNKETERLKIIFKDVPEYNHHILHTRKSRIMIGENKSVFDVDITTVPSSLGFYKANTIKVLLKQTDKMKGLDINTLKAEEWKAGEDKKMNIFEMLDL